jgi:hypothetical protein
MKKSIVLTLLLMLSVFHAFSQDTSPAWIDEITSANATNTGQNIHRHGRVGIGTPFGPLNPITGQLHVRYSNSGWFQGMILQNDGGHSIFTQLGKKNGTNLINWLRFTDNSGVPKTWAFIHDYDNSFRLENEIANTYLRPFIVEWAAPTHAFYMRANGNIGFNTGTPQAKLHVKSERMILEGEGSTSQDFAPVIDFKFEGRNDYWSLFRRGATWPDPNEANNLKFGFNNGSGWINSMRLDPDGNAFFYNSIGIGLLSADMPGKNTDYRLYVEKGILTEKVKCAIKNTGCWADYVFNDDYRLMSLPEVESYIKTNKHLPGLPSAEEVVKEGVDLAAMDAKLLEKIEELTLHLIELKKENTEMKEKLDQLEKR